MIILGAGMAGLLAAHMLRRYSPVVYEAQPMLPNNHHALLRFRTDAVSRATNIPFRRVLVQKGVWYKGRLLTEASFDLQNRYSYKVAGRIVSRSILNLEPGHRFIAPPDFIALLAHGVDVRLGTPASASDIAAAPVSVSTMPMPTLMAMMQWPIDMEFPYTSIETVTVPLPPGTDVYQTIYYPSDEVHPTLYRASITGGVLKMEFVHEAPRRPELDVYVQTVLGHFGVPLHFGMAISTNFQQYGKLMPPSDDAARKSFITAMSDQHNLYSLGRFATWRQLLLDDVVHDVEVIDRFIAARSTYQRKLRSGGF